jgi:polyhydroxyalkanoate synthesis regulator protein
MYDVAASRFMTLKDVAALVEEGHEISVVDNETGEDITEISLMQVLLERAKTKKELAAAPMLLHQLVRASQTVIGDFVRKSVVTSIKALAMTEEDVAEMVQGLALNGHLKKEDTAELTETLLEATKEQQALLDERIGRAVASRLEAMGLGDKLNLVRLVKTVVQSLLKQADKARAKEISELKARIGILQDTVRELSKRVGSTSAQRSRGS